MVTIELDFQVNTCYTIPTLLLPDKSCFSVAPEQIDPEESYWFSVSTNIALNKEYFASQNSGAT